MRHLLTDQYAAVQVVGLVIHTSNASNTNAWLMMIAHLTRLVTTKNARILAIVSFVAAEQNAEQRGMKQSVSAHPVFKEILL